MTKPVSGANPNIGQPILMAPPHACDCHMHVYGPEAAFPYDPNRNYTPPDALLQDYRTMIGKLGLERAVFVQPSVYGINNERHLTAINEMGLTRARGVAVVDTSVSKKELMRLRDGGFRGARFNVVHTGGSTPVEQLETLARMIAEVDWHLQIFIDGVRLPELAPRLRKLPVEFVIDHLGNLDHRRGHEQEGFVALLELLSSGRCWVKLSAPYRFDLDNPPYPKAVSFAQQMIATNPDRVVWGSDWPHPDVPSLKSGANGPMPDDAMLLDALLAWAPSEANRQKILVDNPQKLYGF